MADPQMRLKTSKITYLRNQNRVIYNQDAKIKNGKESIESKEGQYDAAAQYFTFRNGVVIKSKDYLVKSDTLRYDARRDLSNFYGPTYIYSSNSVIYFESGWYNQKNEVAQFSRNASVFSDGKWLYGDSLYYEQKTGYGRGKGNVKLIDTLENLQVFGNFAETFDELNRFYTTDSAQLRRYPLWKKNRPKPRFGRPRPSGLFSTSTPRPIRLFSIPKIRFPYDLAGPTCALDRFHPNDSRYHPASPTQQWARFPFLKRPSPSNSAIRYPLSTNCRPKHARHFRQQFLAPIVGIPTGKFHLLSQR